MRRTNSGKQLAPCRARLRSVVNEGSRRNITPTSNPHGFPSHSFTAIQRANFGKNSYPTPCTAAALRGRVAQNARGVVKGVVKGVTRASFGRRAPLTPRLKRASARRREEKVFRGVYMIQQVAAVHLGWGQAPSFDSNISYESTVWVPLDLY